MKSRIFSFQLILHFLFLPMLPLNHHLCYGEDSISGDHYLSGDETLISKQGKFELGFFKPGKSSNFYVGIWYRQVSKQTIVWVANRETPVKDKYSSVLRIQDANLVLFNESQDPIWSTNVDFVGSSPFVAILHDDGNFVLIEKSLNSSVWESFNHPTDTWLPGAKLSYSKFTWEAQNLTCWENSEDPAPGNYSFKLPTSFGNDNYSHFVMASRRNHLNDYWYHYASVDFDEINFICSGNLNFSRVDNVFETYISYDLINPETPCRLVMDVSGLLKANNLSMPANKCSIPYYCGEYSVCNDNSTTTCNCLEGFEPMSDENWSLNQFYGGCKRKTDLHCADGSARKSKFKMYQNISGFHGLENIGYVNVESMADCESSCLSSCSCSAYGYDLGRSSTCYILNGSLLDLQQFSTHSDGDKTLYVRLAASKLLSSSGKNKSAPVDLVFQTRKKSALVVGCIFVVVLLLVVILFVFWRRSRSMRVIGAEEGSLAVFSYRDLQNATKNFSHKLGAGGFGSVYKGILPDSSVVAVKKLQSLCQGEKQFRAEVSTIGTKQHINLVRLQGFCSQGANKLLVYEYLEKKSLDCQLFSKDGNIILDWKKRYQIALGTARGLAYLHESCRDVIIHCDIKPENILLDADFCPKVADFGLAKLMGRNFSRVLTTVRGTRGYLAPEWLSGVAITPKADVYSFGMMAFELISGKRNWMVSECSEERLATYFPSCAAELMVREGDMMSLLDPRLDGQGDVEEVSRLCKVACWCVQDAEIYRPSMGQVVQILEQVLDVNVPPVPEALQTLNENQERVAFFTDSSAIHSE